MTVGTHASQRGEYSADADRHSCSSSSSNDLPVVNESTDTGQLVSLTSTMGEMGQLFIDR